MRVLVCGGRDFGKREHESLWLLSELAGLNIKHSFSEIINGGASGADESARQFGAIAGIPVTTFKANWLMSGKAAGPIRNQRMIDEGKPDMVVAFPGGRGTADMVRRAELAGLQIVRMPLPSPPSTIDRRTE